MKKIFLENLPTKEGIGRNNNKQVIDWENAVGYKVSFQYKDIQDELVICKYEKVNQILYIDYKTKKNFKISTINLKKCALGKLLDKFTIEFKFQIGQNIKDNNRDIMLINKKYKENINKKGRKQVYKYYQYICNKCGFDCGEHYKDTKYKKELWIAESDLSQGKGCACCCSSSKIVVENINSLYYIAPWIIPYFQNPNDAKLYTKSSGRFITPVCPDCGRIKDKPIKINTIYTRHSISCNCGDGVSYPNKIGVSLLEQLNIYYISEYSPDWIKPKRYDFYFELNNNKYIVEMDGNFHFLDNFMNGQTIEKSNKIDNYKDKLAKENNIEIIRIDCRESNLQFIKNNILNSKLNILFDLNDIDWNRCEEFALTNLCKQACELKYKNPDLTTLDIGNIIKLSRSTITRYLKKGTKLGWCNYNPKEEMRTK